MVIETTRGHKVEIKDELTVREHLEMKKRAISSRDLKSGDALALEEYLFKTYVLSVDGKTENAYDVLVDTLTGSEYEQVNKAIGETLKLSGKE